MNFIWVGEKVVNLDGVNYVKFDGDKAIIHFATNHTGEVLAFEGAEARALQEYFGRNSAGVTSEEDTVPSGEVQKQAAHFVEMTGKDNIITDPDAFVELYQRYVAWCSQHGRPSMELGDFRALLEQRSDMPVDEGTSATDDISRP